VPLVRRVQLVRAGGDGGLRLLRRLLLLELSRPEAPGPAEGYRSTMRFTAATIESGWGT